MKRAKKIFSIILCFLMAVTLVQVSPKVTKASTTDSETSLISGTQTSSNDASRGTGDSYSGLIKTTYDTAVDYFKITYTVDDTSALESWTWLFNFQPFTASWGGWQCNAITLGDSAYEDGTYTAYISMDTIQESCTDGDVAGINVAYCEVADTAVTVTGLYACTGTIPGTTEDTEAGTTTDTATTDVPSSASNDYVKALGSGWNLGNTFDSYDTNLNVEDLGENTWGNPDVTKDLIKGIKAKGFKSIRIPMTTYRRYTKTDGTYVIDDAWLARYKEVVDWCVDEGLYVMINMHHDSGWLSKWDGDTSSEQYKIYTDCWTQIADYFKDEPDTVFFETINEPQFTNNTETNTIYTKLNEINLDAYNIIRNSGGNNADRMIVFPSYNTNQEEASLDNLYEFMSGLNDENIIATIHYYSEWCFSANLGTTGFDDSVNGGDTTSREALNTTFTNVYNKFTAKGFGVIVGEYGLLGNYNANEVGEYVKYLEEVTAVGQKDGFCMMFWDAGNYINRKDTDDYSWFEPRLGAVVEASITGRSSTASCLDELFFKGEASSDVAIPLNITGPEFTGIEGLTEGTDYTYDETTDTITLKTSYMNKKYAELASDEYGQFDDLVITFTSGADWHEYLNKYKTSEYSDATGTTNGIDIPVNYNGQQVRRISAYQPSGAVGSCHTWCNYLTFGSDFRVFYDTNTLTLNASFLGDSSVADGPILLDVEMWDGETVQIWLNKSGTTIDCSEEYAQTTSAAIKTPDSIVVYAGETEIPAQYLNLPDGAKVYGTWSSDSSVMKMDGWPATITFATEPTDFVSGGIVVYYYDITQYINGQFAVKAKPEVSAVTVGVGESQSVSVSNLASDANVSYSIEDTTIATINNGIVTGVKAGTATVTTTVTQYGRTDEFLATVTVTGDSEGIASETPSSEPELSEEPAESPKPSESTEPAVSEEPAESVQPTTSVDVTESALPSATTAVNGMPSVTADTSVGGSVTQKFTIGSGTIEKFDLAKLVIRFNYSKDDTKEQNIWVDNAGISYSCAPYYVNYTSNVKVESTDTYVEYSFSQSQSLSNGTLVLQTRMNNADWSSYTNFQDKGIEVYYDGQLVLTK